MGRTQEGHLHLYLCVMYSIYRLVSAVRGMGASWTRVRCTVPVESTEGVSKSWDFA